jgi:transcriptional regulator with XRE-family HTH domain
MALSFDPDRIRLARETRELTQAGLAQILNIDRQMLSRWERGVVAPSMASFEKIRDALDVPVKFFFVTTVHNVQNEANENGTA